MERLTHVLSKLEDTTKEFEVCHEAQRKALQAYTEVAEIRQKAFMTTFDGIASEIDKVNDSAKPARIYPTYCQLYSF